MNNKISAFLGPLFVAIISVVLTYYLSLNKPDVRYTLSEEIPLSFSTDSDANIENVQQLEVRNVGSAGATEIVVKISGNITNHKVIKYVSSDTVRTFVEQKPVEFVYSALPPQAGFKIIFISSNAVDPSDISVSHSTGQAVDALSVSNRSSTYVIRGIYVLLIGGYLAWAANYFVSSSFDSWKSETKRKRIDQALESSKPWYVSSSKWVNAHVDVIRDLLKEEYVPQERVAYCAAYGLLNQEMPDHFSDSDWKDLNDLAINRLKDHISRATDSYWESSILSVIRLSKPERFPKDDWNSIQTNANEKFIERNKGKIYWKENIVELLYKEKPEAIPDITWQTLQTFFRECYFNELINEINLSNEPESVIERNDLPILDLNQRARLEEMVQQLSKYGDYIAILEALFDGREISDKKPNTLADWDWLKIEKVAVLIAQTKEIETKEKELAQRELKLMEKQSDVENEQTTSLQLKDKVLKQLEFINNVINDPSTIDRIEPYDDTFSPGNWRNMKEIAMLLNSRKAG